MELNVVFNNMKSQIEMNSLDDNVCSKSRTYYLSLSYAVLSPD